MIRRPPRSTQSRSSAASDVYKRQTLLIGGGGAHNLTLIGYIKELLLEVEVLTQDEYGYCLLYTSPSPRDRTRSRMPSSA
ncbi:hypothetical protein CDFC105_103121 [Clostridioides difficile]|nr:hypothetical protein CDFC105_103121 [Clostridioides difficile]